MDTARTIKVTIDSSGAKAGAARVNNALRSIGSTSTKANKETREMEEALHGVGSAASGAAGKGKGFTTFLNGVTVQGKGLAGILEQNAGLFGKVGSAANDGAGKLGMFASAGRAIISLGLPGVIAGITLAFIAAGAAGVAAAAKVEQWKANLLTMVKDTKLMEGAWQGLVSFAKKTPFSIEQSVEGFTKLRAMGLATSEAIMMSYGNTAAATGNSMKQMIEAVADATTNQFERLLAFGIKASQEGNKVKFTFQGVTTTVDKNSKAIQKYLVDIGNKNFAGAMARQMDGLNGAFASLEDNLFMLLATLGDGMFGQAVKDMTNTLADGIGWVTPLVSGLMDVFGGLLNGIWEIAKGVGNLFTVQFGGAEGATSKMQNLAVAGSYIGTVFSIIGKTVGSVLTFIAKTAGWVVNQIGTLFSSLFDWMLPSFDTAGQSAGEALVGILRAGEFVANQLPSIFATALEEVKTMFQQTGSALAKALTGDFSGFEKIDYKFTKTRAAASDTWKKAKGVFSDRKANQKWIADASGELPAGNLNFDALGKDKNADKKKDKKGKDDAAEKAKQQAEFWKGLEQERDLSKLVTQEREKQAKVFEYQKIVGRDITADESKRLDTLLAETKLNQFLTAAKEAHLKAARDIAAQEELYRLKATGATEEQMAVEKAVLDFRNSALEQGVNINDAAYKQAEDALRNDQERNAELEKRNQLLAAGASAAAKYSKSYAEQQQATGFAKDRASLTALYNDGQNPTFTKAQYDEAIKGLDKAIGDAAEESSLKMADAWGKTIEDLGDDIGGVFGKAFSKVGKMVQSLVSGASGDAANAGPLGKVASLLGDDAKEGFKEASKGLLSDLGGLFGDPSGKFAKSIGSALGKASGGMAMGSMADTGLKALGIKSSGTGAQLGGAIGALSGIPGGSIIGGIFGGVVGGLFKKAKYATASISQLASGELGVGSIKGNKSSYKDNANTAAGSVISGIQQIAAELGATLSGSPSVSIGMYKKDWRVSDTGRTGKLKGKYSDVSDFGDDAEAAIAYAIQVALQDGILTGISEFSQKVIKANGDEKAISLAKSYESILDSLAAFNNPIKAAVESAVKDIDTLADQMKAAGATAADLANVEQYRSLKLKEILDEQLGDFNDTLKMLKGDASGKSPLALFKEDYAELDKFRTTLNSGGTVDSADFNNLIQEVMSEAGDIWGLQSKDYQDVLSDLTSLTQQAIGNATNEFNNAATGAEGTTAAVQETTDAVNAQTTVLEDIRDLLANGSKTTGSSLTSLTGKLLKAN